MKPVTNGPPTMSPEPGYLTLEEAAAYLHVSQDTVREWVRCKGLPHHKPGKLLLFRRRDLDAWMNRYRRGLSGFALRASD